MFNFKFNKKILVSLAIFLGLVLGSVLIMSRASCVKIETVDVTGLVDSFIKETVKQQLTEEEKKTRVSQFSHLLQKNINQEANDRHVVILPREAVLAGSVDVTEKIASKIKQALNK